MSVLIKGIDMPSGCGLCPFCDYEQGCCLATNDNKPTQSGAFRESWCPLVEVKSKGRLIDEQAFIENAVKYSRQSLKTIGEALSATPTIIEAEGYDG